MERQQNIRHSGEGRNPEGWGSGDAPTNAPPIKHATFMVTLSDGEDGYIDASCPSLPGCHTQGKDRKQAIANIKEAIEIYVEHLRDESSADQQFVQVPIAV